jgi:hypothetical protein
MEHEEKSVIIPYRDWHDKYLPMEQEVNRLKQELAEKDVVLHLQAPHIFIGAYYNFTTPKKIGYLDIDKNFHSSQDYDYVIESVLRDLRRSARKDDIILSKQQAKYYIGEIESKLNEVGNRQKEVSEKYSSVLKKEKEVALLMKSVSDKINSLPRIVRWLFGIKKID